MYRAWMIAIRSRQSATWTSRASPRGRRPGSVHVEGAALDHSRRWGVGAALKRCICRVPMRYSVWVVSVGKQARWKLGSGNRDSADRRRDAQPPIGTDLAANSGWGLLRRQAAPVLHVGRCLAGDACTSRSVEGRRQALVSMTVRAGEWL